jgi:ribosomal subunit interface protein
MVRVQITERHCDVPRELRERAETQMEALAKFSPRATAADVVFMEEKVTRVVEVIVHIDGDEPVVARADDKEFHGALDKVLERLSRQLREQRDIRTDHKAPPRRDRAGRG